LRQSHQSAIGRDVVVENQSVEDTSDCPGYTTEGGQDSSSFSAANNSLSILDRQDHQYPTGQGGDSGAHQQGCDDWLISSSV